MFLDLQVVLEKKQKFLSLRRIRGVKVLLCVMEIGQLRRGRQTYFWYLGFWGDRKQIRSVQGQKSRCGVYQRQYLFGKQSGIKNFLKTIGLIVCFDLISVIIKYNRGYRIKLCILLGVLYLRYGCFLRDRGRDG